MRHATHASILGFVLEFPAISNLLLFPVKITLLTS